LLQCYCREFWEMLTYSYQSFLSQSLSWTCNWSWHCSCIVLIFHKVQKWSSPGLQPGTNFCSWDLCSCKLLTETNIFNFGVSLHSCLVTKLQKTFSLRLKARIVFRGCGLFFCILLFKTNTFGLGAILLLLSFWAIGIVLTRTWTQDNLFFGSSDLSKISSWPQEISWLNLMQICVCPFSI
jgi:hypothetical protein